ncbi:hypothetical protein L227DRAFT_126984 [Lentinus tigrinus ALCF2SS1-6]|uniref:Uncharacterized protein n=1 Tax=Lentinus tigrinus ALCF2SS1-6 TaxID=1328759 RepID=A0A5C2SQ68_9APHY|nr:hypothetical protein L227DRAFT_126984 [Lentinus tigrinus ALCF2SS1-6]
MSSSIRARSPRSSLSSYDFFSHSRTGSRVVSSGSEASSGSYGSASEDDGSSDDEILLSFSDLSSADFRSQRGELRTPAIFSDDEFVLMSRPRSPESDASSDLTESFSALSLSQASIVSQVHRRSKSDGGASAQGKAASSPGGGSKRRSRKRRAAQAPGNAVTSGAAPTKTLSSPESPKHHSPSKARRKARRAAARAAALCPRPAAGLGDRPIVDDVSEAGSESPYIHQELYQSAQRYVSSVLSADPSTQMNMPKLAFLQALIIELGLYSPVYDEDTHEPEYPSLPNSMRAAKALLKSQVFLNVRDYLAVRSQGIDALRSVMHPNRTALMREIRGGKRAPVKTVKETGLDVLLVTCFR